MDSALLQNLLTGTGSVSQFIGGLVVVILYATIGLLGAAGSNSIFRGIFQGRWELIFWAAFLVAIASFYVAFSTYFGVSSYAWQTEIVGVVVFLVCAVLGLFTRSAIAVDYVLHGLWDLTHSISGFSLAGLSLTAIPLGYPGQAEALISDRQRQWAHPTAKPYLGEKATAYYWFLV